MISHITVPEGYTIKDYVDAYPELGPTIRELGALSGEAARRLKGCTVWMVNSTAQGGGVAEGLPRVVSLMRQLGVKTEWVVISPEDRRFFPFTKRLHNLIHGNGDRHLSLDDRALYESVSRSLAKDFRAWLKPDDLLVVNDPQPLGLGALLKRELDLRSVWRCHIGVEGQTPATRAAWEFLKPWARAYDRTIFSLKEYVPPFLSDRTEIIHPTIDPLSHKNRELSAQELADILEGAALGRHPSSRASFGAPALRLQQDGSFAPAVYPEEFGLLSHPIVGQISRWDHLKGFAPLLRGFVYLKKNRWTRQRSERHQRRLDSVRLVLAGPDPDGVQDDPEAQEVFQEVCGLWEKLDPDVQQDIAILKLPMASPEANALMVNALQRCSSIVAQNSLQEGFGLSVTEAMWKARPILGTHAAGIRAQVLDGEHGRLVREPENPEVIATALDEMLGNEELYEACGYNGRSRVAENFLIFEEVHRWLEVLPRVGGRQATDKEDTEVA